MVARSVGIHRSRRQLVAHAGGQGQRAGGAPLVLHEQADVLGAQLLRVVERRADRDRRQTKQQVRQAVAGVGKRSKRQLPAGLDVAERILAHGPQVEPALDQVCPGAPGNRVDELKRVGDALLGVVVFLPERRVAGDGDEAQGPNRAGSSTARAGRPGG